MNTRSVDRRRLVSVLAAVAGLVVVTAIGPVGSARAASGVDQITGVGATDSAVTRAWADGITGADNKTVVTPRQPKGTSPFVDDLYANYQNLKVTVSQTKGLTHQSVQVTWTGATPTLNRWQGDFLQIMQCYGDANAGPDPENCQWGGFTVASLPDPWTVQSDHREGQKCPANGCDPAEPKAGHNHPDVPEDYDVPFIPADTDQKIYRQAPRNGHPDDIVLGNYFNQFTTNELPAAFTSADGTGQEFFETQTGREAAGLGCGDPDNAVGGAPRGCWLVIIPRATLQPDGKEPNNSTGWTASALGATTWAQRIQVRLNFQSTSITCPSGSDQRPIVGTELMANAITSWEPALCANGGTVYGFSTASDATNAAQLSNTFIGSAGMAFTTTPIDFGGGGPPLLYAPVAVTALTLSFHIDQITGQNVQKLQHAKLIPSLLSKALTQVYLSDIPGGNGYSPGTKGTPSWVTKDWRNITNDPQWQQVNPGVQAPGLVAGSPLAPLVTEDQSDLNRTVWSWMQSDPGARAWLRGQSDANGLVENSNYKGLHLGEAPPSNTYPRADSTCYRPTDNPEIPAGQCLGALDVLPYMNGLEDAAIHVQRNDNGSRTSLWDIGQTNPNGLAGYWGRNSPPPTGNRFNWGVTATPYAAKYGLPNMSLCNPDGGGCVTPSTDTIRAAVDGAQPDSAGLLHVDPADPGVGGYPLTEIVYAAVRTDQDSAALRDYARVLDYAAGAGQAPGVGVGQLPAGYLPLPDALRKQTRAVADTLRADAAAQPNGNSPSGPGPSSSSPPSTTPSPSTAAGHATAPPKPASARPVSGPTASTGQVPAELAAKATPGTDVGALRWALLAVLICGLVGALAGPLIKHSPTGFTRVFRRPF